MSGAPFKICAVCGYEWQTATDFLNDPEIQILGYQPNFKKLEAGYFLFNHGGGNTLAIPIEAFSDFREGPVFTENLAGKETCPGYCVHKWELSACQQHCECRWVRDVMQIIKNWEKVH